jgi:hypothetical protein
MVGIGSRRMFKKKSMEIIFIRFENHKIIEIIIGIQ